MGSPVLVKRSGWRSRVHATYTVSISATNTAGRIGPTQGVPTPAEPAPLAGPPTPRAAGPSAADRQDHGHRARRSLTRRYAKPLTPNGCARCTFAPASATAPAHDVLVLMPDAIRTRRRRSRATGVQLLSPRHPRWRRTGRWPRPAAPARRSSAAAGPPPVGGRRTARGNAAPMTRSPQSATPSSRTAGCQHSDLSEPAADPHRD